jgi:hypothetical protein
MKRLVAVTVMLAVVLSACSKKQAAKGEDGGKDSSCSPAPSAVADSSKLPSGFPTAGMTITSIETQGPSIIVEGSREADLDESYEEFKTAFSGGGYAVTDSEKEEDDAEVNFSGNGTNGQVRLGVPCEGRTSVTITIRPG